MGQLDTTAFADIDDAELTEEEFVRARDEVCAAFAEAEGRPRAGQLVRLDYTLSIALIAASTAGFLLYGFLVVKP